MTATSTPAIDFSEILVATDFSDTSDSALTYAKAIARAFGSELLLVHVADPVAHITVPEAAWADDPARVQCEVEATQNAGVVLRAEGLKAKDVCAFGGVAEEVVQAAENHHATLIITGSHCRKGLNRMLFGSEAESILKSSKVPVLMVGRKAARRADIKISFRSIICAVALDTHGADVAALARHFAGEHGSRFQTVCFPLYEPTQEMDGHWAFRNRLEKVIPINVAKDISPVVLSEPPAESLVELAIARDADLIVFDQRTSFLSPHLRGGVLTDVLANVPCPVLAVPDAK